MAITSFLSEVIALLFAIIFKNNLVIYNIEMLINGIVILVYFKSNNTIPKKRNALSIIIFLTIISWVFSIYLQKSFSTINTGFMIYEGVMVIALSLFSLDKISTKSRKKVVKITRSSVFWISTIFLFYWLMTFVQWMLYESYPESMKEFEYLELFLTLTTIMVNICYSVIFYISPKLDN